MSFDVHIPLLSGRPLCDWSPEEYRNYIRSLYFKRTAKKAPSKKKPFTVRVSKKGKITLKINRTPPWISEAEMRKVCEEKEIPLSTFFIALKELGGVLSTEAEQREILRLKEEIPW